MKLNRKMQGSLGTTLVLTLVALWLDAPAPQVVASVPPRSGALDTGLAPPRPVVRNEPSSGPSLPEQWTRDELSVATKDPFALVVATPATSPTASTSPSLQMAPPPAPVPPLNARYAGSFIDPDGVKHVFLWSGSRQVPAEPGLVLEGGHVVHSVGAETIVLTYPGSDTTTTISIPPPAGDPDQVADAGAEG